MEQVLLHFQGGMKMLSEVERACYISGDQNMLIMLDGINHAQAEIDELTLELQNYEDRPPYDSIEISDVEFVIDDTIYDIIDVQEKILNGPQEQFTKREVAAEFEKMIGLVRSIKYNI